jgi:hypothetical protein
MDTFRMIAGFALALFLIYWVFAAFARAEFGLDLPDPGALLPSGWRFR